MAKRNGNNQYNSNTKCIKVYINCTVTMLIDDLEKLKYFITDCTVET